MMKSQADHRQITGNTTGKMVSKYLFLLCITGITGRTLLLVVESSIYMYIREVRENVITGIFSISNLGHFCLLSVIFNYINRLVYFSLIFACFECDE